MLREVIEGTIRGLSEKKIDLSVSGGGTQERWIGKDFNANEQNENIVPKAILREGAMMDSVGSDTRQNK